MALECCIFRHPNNLIEVEPRISGVHYVEIDENTHADLIPKINYYLEHEKERKEIAHNGRLWYERNGTAIARAKKIFEDCKSLL